LVSQRTPWSIDIQKSISSASTSLRVGEIILQVGQKNETIFSSKHPRSAPDASPQGVEAPLHTLVQGCGSRIEYQMRARDPLGLLFHCQVQGEGPVPGRMRTRGQVAPQSFPGNILRANALDDPRCLGQ